jgi:hypothetical protein
LGAGQARFSPGRKGFDMAGVDWRGKAPTGYAKNCLIACIPSGRLLGVSHLYNGSWHDSHDFRSEGVAQWFERGTAGHTSHWAVLADLGLQGCDKDTRDGMKELEIPYKRPAGGVLTAEQQEYNFMLSRNHHRKLLCAPQRQVQDREAAIPGTH